MNKIVLIGVLAIVFLSACATTQVSNKCNDLKNAFDERSGKGGRGTAIIATTEECDAGNPIIVGGTLLEITKGDEGIYGYYYRLNFQGDTETSELYMNSGEEQLPYQVGTFYKFDLQNRCKNRYSMFTSGSFSDPNKTNLQAMSC